MPYLGRRLSDVARDAGALDLNSDAAFEAVFDFFAVNDGEISIITHYGNEATIGAVLPPTHHGDLHRRADAGPRTKAASAGARSISKGATHGP